MEEKLVYAAMSAIKAECIATHAEWGGKCPKDQSVCPLYFGKCFFAKNKPKNWTIVTRAEGETEWHSEV